MTTSDQIACGLIPPSSRGIVSPHIVGRRDRFAQIIVRLRVQQRAGTDRRSRCVGVSFFITRKVREIGLARLSQVGDRISDRTDLRDSFGVRKIRIGDSRITCHLSECILIRFINRRGRCPRIQARECYLIHFPGFRSINGRTFRNRSRSGLNAFSWKSLALFPA